MLHLPVTRELHCQVEFRLANRYSRAYASNDDVRELVNWLLTERPEMLPRALMCLAQNKKLCHYRETGELQSRDCPGVPPQVVTDYNMRMRSVYDLIGEDDETAGSVRGVVFEEVVRLLFERAGRRPGQCAYRDAAVYVDQKVVSIRDQWDSGDTASSVDVALWDHGSGPIEPGYFCTCKINARYLLARDMAYLYELRRRVDGHAELFIASAVGKGKKTAALIQALLEKPGVMTHEDPGVVWYDRELLGGLARGFAARADASEASSSH